MWDYMSNSHQISQSTSSLLLFKGQVGCESKAAVECSQKNKTGLAKVLVLPAGRPFLMEHGSAEA